jgi:hypothetical protein
VVMTLAFNYIKNSILVKIILSAIFDGKCKLTLGPRPCVKNCATEQRSGLNPGQPASRFGLAQAGSGWLRLAQAAKTSYKLRFAWSLLGFPPCMLRFKSRNRFQ